MKPYLVIGSGPAGISAAKALLANGKRVLLIDAGKELPERSQAMKTRLAKENPKSWLIEEPQDNGALVKRTFGSDYMYDTPEFHLGNVGAATKASFAQGGLSTVWGAAILPYEKADMAAWPPINLKPYYKKVLEYVPLAGKEDGLSQRFPLYAEPQPLEISSQISGLLQLWRINFPRHGFGQSRLALQVYPRKQSNGCVYCDLCMSGCPYNLIYSTTQTLAELKRNSNFQYQQGIVERVSEERRDGTLVTKVHLGSSQFIEAEKVFLAAGNFPSTAIMLNSLECNDASFKDSQQIIIPALVRHKVDKKNFALSQAFLEWRDVQLGNVHMQFYQSGPLIERGVMAKLGRFYPFLKWLLRPIMSRMIIIQAYLHSDVSGQLSATKTASKFGLSISGKANVIGKSFPRNLLRNWRKLGFLPLTFLAEFPLPGNAFHSGGSFPMGKQASTEEGHLASDTLGRCGFENVHLVDSSIFPSIAPTTITLTEMANAYRIADEVSR